MNMRIAVDAMGTDEFPGPDVAGAVEAARRWDDEIILVGDESVIAPELARHNVNGLNLTLLHAPEMVTMMDKPSEVIRGKPNSSMHVGLQLVVDGKADAFVSAGNTGGLVAVATLGPMKRIRGVKRTANAAVIPLPTGNFVFLDVGVNAEAKPEWLYQFALMGSLFAEKVLGIEDPRVALLSNGEEEGKGNELVRESALLLADSILNFVGNAEPKELLNGHADVGVADGFAGNVFTKTLEAGVRLTGDLIREEIRAGMVSTVGGLLARPAFKRVARRFSAEAVGGAPLLGVDGVVITAHGRSNDAAIMNAIRQARLAVQGGLVQAIREGLQR
jgi:glycerol-3-phosphate acyltransferase PlsX